MMNRQPKELTFSMMKDIVEHTSARFRDHYFLSHELGIVYGDPQIFHQAVMQDPPFSIGDYRMGLLEQGELHAVVNLREHCFTAGSLVVLCPGTVVHPLSVSPDLRMKGIALFPDFPMPFGVGQMPAAFNGQQRDLQVRVGEGDAQTVSRIIDTLWHVVRQPHYSMAVVSSLVAALLHHIDVLYRRQSASEEASRSREQTIFDRFIYLVNQHCQRQHQIGFYADKMCLTERYLGTVVRQASGVTAKEWIDRALTTQAKVLLLHSRQSVAQVSDELCFPNASFFSKYFRRMTGLTPNEYRAGNAATLTR